MTYENRHLKNIFLIVHLATQAGASIFIKHPSGERMGTEIGGSLEKESSQCFCSLVKVAPVFVEGRSFTDCTRATVLMA